MCQFPFTQLFISFYSNRQSWQSELQNTKEEKSDFWGGSEPWNLWPEPACQHPPAQGSLPRLCPRTEPLGKARPLPGASAPAGFWQGWGELAALCFLPVVSSWFTPPSLLGFVKKLLKCKSRVGILGVRLTLRGWVFCFLGILNSTLTWRAVLGGFWTLKCFPLHFFLYFAAVFLFTTQSKGVFFKETK